MNTTQQYLSLDTAYEFFNLHLFDGKLPPCLITFQRRKCYGYFHAKKFTSTNPQEPGKQIDEISLNPDYFHRDEKEVLSTLVHEMVHVWRFHKNEKKPRPGYHDQLWAAKMMLVGLRPTTTGTLDGKQIGQNVSHLVMKGGRFEELFNQLVVIQGVIIDWTSVEDEEQKKRKKRGQKSSKTKFSCGVCGQNAWGAPSIEVICGFCHEKMTREIRE